MSLPPGVPAERSGSRGAAVVAGSATTSSPPSTATQRQRPVLASDVLRDDLVPREPGARAMRVTLGVAGALLVGIAARQGLGNLHALAAWGIPGVTALLVALAPVSYATRALLALAPALPAFAVQAMSWPGASAPSALLWTAVCATLPASLLFRANFRASRRARVFVAIALVTSVVWLLYPTGGALWLPPPLGQAWLFARLPGIVLAAVCLVSLMAFMGTNTTGGCRAWAVGAVIWSALTSAWPVAALPGVDTAVRTAAVVNGIGMGSLCGVLGVTIGALLAEYARPSEPRTGIGLAATAFDRRSSGS